MNNANQTEAEHSFFDRLKNCAALFVSLSSALLIAFLAARIVELSALSSIHTLPEDFRIVVVQAFLFDIVSFLKMLPFLFIPFFIVCFSTNTTRSHYRAYRAGGSIV